MRPVRHVRPPAVEASLCSCRRGIATSTGRCRRCASEAGARMRLADDHMRKEEAAASGVCGELHSFDACRVVRCDKRVGHDGAHEGPSDGGWPPRWSWRDPEPSADAGERGQADRDRFALIDTLQMVVRLGLHAGAYAERYRELLAFLEEAERAGLQAAQLLEIHRGRLLVDPEMDRLLHRLRDLGGLPTPGGAS